MPLERRAPLEGLFSTSGGARSEWHVTVLAADERVVGPS